MNQKFNIALTVIVALLTLLLASASFGQNAASSKSPCCAATGMSMAGMTEDQSAAATDKPATPEQKLGNVWHTADGKEYFTCPVMSNSALVADAEGYSVIDDVKYYHCCPACQAPFRAHPAKYLKDFALPANITAVDEQGAMRFRDPVSGEEGALGDKTLRFDRDGQRYFFTNAKTLKTFEKNPEKYLPTPKA